MNNVPEKRPLLVTDLDGSLLDHHSYDFSPAQPLLEQLETLNIPVIPATSKTAAEVISLRTRINNRHPFIAENGAAIYIPEGYFNQLPGDTRARDGWQILEFSSSRHHWLEILDSIAPEFGREFRGFRAAGVDGIIALTGLDRKSAQLANQRDYSEPVAWLGDEARKSRFVAALRERGANVLQGGRFLSISGDCDKGRALRSLANLYRLNNPGTEFVTLAIGDSNNDIAMLESADYALVIKSDNHPAPVLKRQTGISYSATCGPGGWREGVMAWLKANNPDLKLELV